MFMKINTIFILTWIFILFDNKFVLFVKCVTSFSTSSDSIIDSSSTELPTFIGNTFPSGGIAECVCEYYRLEGYYIWHNFTQTPNYTHRQIHLNPNGRLQYRCVLSIPKCHNSKMLRVSGRSSRIPEVFTKDQPTLNLSRGICEDLQIAIEMPFKSTGNDNVSEEAYLDTDNRKFDREIYVAWLNVTSFNHNLEGDYWFHAKQPLIDNVLCRHRLSLALHHLKKDAHPIISKNTKMTNKKNTTFLNDNEDTRKNHKFEFESHQTMSSDRKRYEGIVIAIFLTILFLVIMTFFVFLKRLKAKQSKISQDNSFNSSRIPIPILENISEIEVTKIPKIVSLKIEKNFEETNMIESQASESQIQPNSKQTNSIFHKNDKPSTSFSVLSRS